MSVVDAGGARLDDVDLFAVASGPGSFTGLRVGIATMQGLAFAQQKQVAPVPALDAHAWLARDRGTIVGAWMDARRGEVFAALYGDDGSVLRGATALSPSRTLEAWREALHGAAAVTFVGGGAVRYRRAIESSVAGATIVEPTPLVAGAIGQIASHNPSIAVLPHAVIPVYVRRPDAELARERRQHA
jgi:tRNA threonylcarbamoyladenosine biosynthesis protein TsaB